MTSHELQELKLRIQAAHFSGWDVAKSDEIADELADDGATKPRKMGPFATHEFLKMIDDLENPEAPPAPPPPVVKTVVAKTAKTTKVTTPVVAPVVTAVVDAPVAPSIIGGSSDATATSTEKVAEPVSHKVELTDTVKVDDSLAK